MQLLLASTSGSIVLLHQNLNFMFFLHMRGAFLHSEIKCESINPEPHSSMFLLLERQEIKCTLHRFYTHFC